MPPTFHECRCQRERHSMCPPSETRRSGPGQNESGLLKRSESLLPVNACDLASLELGPEGGQHTQPTLDQAWEPLGRKSGGAPTRNMHLRCLIMLKRSVALKTHPGLDKPHRRLPILNIWPWPPEGLNSLEEMRLALQIERGAGTKLGLPSLVSPLPIHDLPPLEPGNPRVDGSLMLALVASNPWRPSTGTGFIWYPH